MTKSIYGFIKKKKQILVLFAKLFLQVQIYVAHNI